ncbi:YhgE/Pip domain-containing protein [Oceanobacillus neutriphilus]|uniref:Phage infection protein n=1 Tax=Oceanobacillus neutriphilus TaxID=531815 RepID=A0ABQ2P2H4_9BACI|nr:ABC transporter permease [Oceanobacillus neutriphilus]GGP16352.1 phage infection protein [Oceanobacillus neutriphilus]
MNKKLIILPVLSFIIVFIFSLTLFPTVQPEPKDLPIAIVNDDQGAELPDESQLDLGDVIVDMIQSFTEDDGDSPIEWIAVNSENEVLKGMDDQEYYAALVIPEDFSSKQISFLQSDEYDPLELKVYINEGMNMTASAMTSNLLDGIAENVNDNSRNELLELSEEMGIPLSAEQISNLAEPVTKTEIIVNEIGENSMNGNAPMSLFQPLWIASLLTAILSFFALRGKSFSSTKEHLIARVWQITSVVVASIFIGFGLTWLASGMVGLNIPNFMDTALFLSLTSFSYISMILVVLTLIGVAGIPIFILLLFFAIPLLNLVPEMMSSFYHDWVYSWLPMRFMVEGVRKLLYFGESFTWNFEVSVLFWIGLVSVAILLGISFKRNSEKNIEVKE